MVTQSKGSATGSIFLSSPPNSAFGKTLRNNMDSNSFLRGNYTETILSNSKTAIFATTNSMRNRDDYKECQVCKTLHKPQIIFKPLKASVASCSFLFLSYFLNMLLYPTLD